MVGIKEVKLLIVIVIVLSIFIVLYCADKQDKKRRKKELSELAKHFPSRLFNPTLIIHSEPITFSDVTKKPTVRQKINREC